MIINQKWDKVPFSDVEFHVGWPCSADKRLPVGLVGWL